MLRINTSKIFDMKEFISLNREQIKKDIHDEYMRWMNDVSNAHTSYYDVYMQYRPKFVAAQIVDVIDKDFEINPEERAILIENLMDDDNMLRYFYEGT